MFKRGENHHLWKGKKVGYSVLHRWVQNNLGIADECSECGSKSKVEWANISKKYKRDLSDYKQLCHSCHMKYDNISNKVWETRRLRYGTVGHKKETSWKGWKHSIKSKIEMSKRRKGIKFTEEHKKNLSISIKKYWDNKKTV